MSFWANFGNTLANAGKGYARDLLYGSLGADLGGRAASGLGVGVTDKRPPEAAAEEGQAIRRGMAAYGQPAQPVPAAPPTPMNPFPRYGQKPEDSDGTLA